MTTKPFSLFPSLAYPLLAAILLSLPSLGVSWRDSGEFLLAGSFLDIAHAPGFPLYAQLANFFACLPFGSLPWRVHVFSALNIVCLLGLLHVLLLMLVRAYLPNISAQRFTSLVIFLLLAAPLLSLPSLLRQAALAEVYVLHANLCLGFFLAAWVFLEKQDLRYLALCTFLMGLAACNHVASILISAPLVCILVYTLFRTSLFARGRSLGILFIFGMLALSIYVYLPLRAHAGPPLSTGDPRNLPRMFALLTDKIDREIRPEIIPVQNLLGSGRSLFGEGLFKMATKIAQEIPLFFLVLSLAGFFALASYSKGLAVMALWAILSQFLFFFNWDPDPWVLSFALLIVLSAFALCVLLAQVKRFTPQAMCILAFGCALVLVIQFPRHIQAVMPSQNSHAIRQVYEERLREVPTNAFLALETSWFIGKYLKEVEGLRPDILLSFTPQLIYPELFRPLRLEKSGYFFQSGHFGEQLSFLAKDRELWFEPSTLLMQRFAKIAQYRDALWFSLAPGHSGNLDEEQFLENAEKFIRLLDFENMHEKAFQKDARNYREALVLSTASMLEKAERKDMAKRLLEILCEKQAGGLGCSRIALVRLEMLKPG